MPPIKGSKYSTASSEVDAILRIKLSLQKSIHCAPFIILNLLFLCLVAWDIFLCNYSIGTWLLPRYQRSAKYGEVCCFLLAIINTFSSFVLVLWPRLKMELVQLTPRQIQLLGMLDLFFGKRFGISKDQKNRLATPKSSPGLRSGDLDWLFKIKSSSGSDSIRRRSTFASLASSSDSQLSIYGSPGYKSFSSPFSNHSSKDYSPSQSPSFYVGTPSSTPKSYASPVASPSLGSDELSRSFSYYRPDLMDPVQAKFRENLSRLRRAKSSSPFKKKHIRSREQLRKYLEDFEEEEHGSPDCFSPYNSGDSELGFTPATGQVRRYELAPLLSDDSLSSSFSATKRSATSPGDWLSTMLNRSTSFDSSRVTKTPGATPPPKQSRKRSETGSSVGERSLSETEITKETEAVGSYQLWEKSHFEDMGKVLAPGSLLRGEDTKLVLQPISPVHWVKYDLDPDNLDLYTQNLRSWISRTILKPLVAEVEALNKIFENQARPDLRIGEASLSSLQHILLSRNPDQLPTLHKLLPFLEVHSNQQYVVERIKDLVKDGCLQQFKANAGGSELIVGSEGKTRVWDSHLPTDGELIWHMFATYMDAQLPPDPLCPDGKSFSSKYFLKSPAVPNKVQQAPRASYIWQSAKVPTSYRLFNGVEKFAVDVGKGKHSLFHVIILFLAHVQKEEDGKLGQISLHETGLNLLWVLEM